MACTTDWGPIEEKEDEMNTALEYSTSDLMAEIRHAHDEINGQSYISKSDLMNFVMAKWPTAPSSRDLFFRFDSVGNAVDRFIRSVKKRWDEGEADQPDLPEVQVKPGFKHLQEKYVITRDGEQGIVTLEGMNLKEIEAKAREHERWAEGHLAHADELRRYARERGE